MSDLPFRFQSREHSTVYFWYMLGRNTAQFPVSPWGSVSQKFSPSNPCKQFSLAKRSPARSWISTVSDVEGCIELHSHTLAKPAVLDMHNLQCPEIVVVEHLTAQGWRPGKRIFLFALLCNPGSQYAACCRRCCSSCLQAFSKCELLVFGPPVPIDCCILVA